MLAYKVTFTFAFTFAFAFTFTFTFTFGGPSPHSLFFVFDLKKLLEQEGGPNPQAMSYPVGSLYRARRDVGVVVVRVLWRVGVNDKTFTIYM